MSYDRTGLCINCGERVIQGKGGWRRRLSVPLRLMELYRCLPGMKHNPL